MWFSHRMTLLILFKNLNSCYTDVALPDGCFYFDDMIGVGCFDAVSGERIGTVEAVDEGVACFYYRISGESNYYIPNVDAYVVDKDPEKGLFVKDYEGLKSEGKA